METPQNSTSPHVPPHYGHLMISPVMLRSALLHERLDVGRRDEPHLMSQLANLAAPEVGTSASFNRDNASLQLPEESQHLIPP